MSTYKRRAHTRATKTGRTKVRETTVKANKASDKDPRAKAGKTAAKKTYQEKRKGKDSKTAAKEGAKAGIDEI